MLVCRCGLCLDSDVDFRDQSGERPFHFVSMQCELGTRSQVGLDLPSRTHNVPETKKKFAVLRTSHGSCVDRSSSLRLHHAVVLCAQRVTDGDSPSVRSSKLYLDLIYIVSGASLCGHFELKTGIHCLPCTAAWLSKRRQSKHSPHLKVRHISLLILPVCFIVFVHTSVSPRGSS